MELETFFTVTEQTKLFLLSCLFGIPIGIFFDVFRVIRIIFPHNKIIVAIEDIIFLFLYAIFIISFSIISSRSELRFFYVVGNLLGFTLYFFTVGNLVVNIIKKFFLLINKFLKKILHPFTTLYTSICEKLKGFFVEIFKNNKITIKKSKYS